MSALVYVVPTRGRPGNAAELIDAFDTTRAGVADLVLAVDDDDTRLEEYRALERPEWCSLIVGPRLRLGGTLNLITPGYARTGAAGVGFMGDDHRPRSLRWDEQLAAELEATPGAVVYGNDLVQGPALPTAVLLDARIVDELGYFVPPGMLHLWLDNYWLELGRRLGTLRYRTDVVIEHVHPITGRAEWDDGYRENNAPAVWDHDETRYRAHLSSGQLDGDVAAVRRRLELELELRRHDPEEV
jgi:hypothetical protein